jgi:hypothetical protein
MGLIPNYITEIFHYHNPSSHNMALGWTQHLTELSTGIFLGTKCGRCLGLTNLPPSCADCFEMWEHQNPGNISVCPAWDCFILIFAMCLVPVNFVLLTTEDSKLLMVNGKALFP